MTSPDETTAFLSDPQEITIVRQITLPDRLRVNRYRQVPELGPRILFFSGGSALRDISRQLINYTWNSIHLVTPFDSGGSSAGIRQAFSMLSVGDLRNRLMSLADPKVHGNHDIYRLFAHRFSHDASPVELRQELGKMVKGEHPLVASIADPMRKVIRNHLRYFEEQMPEAFDLRGASIGNLILTGGYLNTDESIDTVIFMFSRMVEVRGTVRPIVSTNLHLAAELADGRTIVGQHLLTGKEAQPLTSPISELFLSESVDPPKRAKIEIRNKVKALIDDAELIVYPVGSFYSSLIANLLPDGVGRAIAANQGMKVFLPNPTPDPEMLGLTTEEAIERLLIYLQRDCQQVTSNDKLLNYVLIDSRRGNYPGSFDRDAIRARGLHIIDTPLISDASAPYLDAALVCETLISLT